jgi:hypothetical protein
LAAIAVETEVGFEARFAPSKLGVRSRAQAVALVLREERDVSGHGVHGDALHLLV